MPVLTENVDFSGKWWKVPILTKNDQKCRFWRKMVESANFGRKWSKMPIFTENGRKCHFWPKIGPCLQVESEVSIAPSSPPTFSRSTTCVLCVWPVNRPSNATAWPSLVTVDYARVVVRFGSTGLIIENADFDWKWSKNDDFERKWC